MRKHWSFRVAAAAATMVVTGCGGGGGGEGAGASQPPAPDTRLTVDSSTYTSGFSLVFASAGTTTSLSLMASTAFDVFTQIPGLVPLSIPCPDGGTASLTAEDRDGNAVLSVGDRVTHRLQQCTVEGTVSSELIHIDVLNTAVQGDPQRLSLRITISESETTYSSGNSLRLSGGFTVENRSTATEERFIVALDQMTVTQIEPTRQQISRLRKYSLDYLQNYQTNTFRLSTEGEIQVENNFVNGYITFDTGTALTGILGQYPSTGRVTVHGFNNGFARIEEGLSGDLAAGTVTLSLDSNGQGPVDSTSVINWVTLVRQSLFSSFYDSEIA